MFESTRRIFGPSSVHRAWGRKWNWPRSAWLWSLRIWACGWRSQSWLYWETAFPLFPSIVLTFGRILWHIVASQWFQSNTWSLTGDFYLVFIKIVCEDQNQKWNPKKAVTQLGETARLLTPPTHNQMKGQFKAQCTRAQIGQPKTLTPQLHFSESLLISPFLCGF